MTVESTHKAIFDLIQKREDLKTEIRIVEKELTDHIVHFDGTLVEALRLRLIRLNFAAPSGFLKYLQEG